MKKLEVPDWVKEKHKKYFKDKVLDKIEKKIDLTSGNEKEFWECCKENWETLAVGKPKDWRKIEKEKFGTAYQRISQVTGMKKCISDIFSYSDFSDKSKKADVWDAYMFAKGIIRGRTCPYCNQNFTFVIEDNKEDGRKICRPSIDHFYPQHEYPYLALSLYNMVPCCEVCNMRLKQMKKMRLEILNPYEFDMDEAFRFEFQFDMLDEKKGITMRMNLFNEDYIKTFQEYKKTFHLELLYNEHQATARKIYERYQKYGDGYFKQLQRLLGDGEQKQVAINEEEMRELRWSHIPSKEEILDEPLNKMRKDLIEQLEFGIHEEKDEKQEEKFQSG